MFLPGTLPDVKQTPYSATASGATDLAQPRNQTDKAGNIGYTPERYRKDKTVTK